MSRFDQMGPIGQGHMTGRRMGRCAGNAADNNQITENLEMSQTTAGVRRRLRDGSCSERSGRRFSTDIQSGFGGGRGRGMARNNP